ncbi:hypothetical protein Llab_1769 [Lactococcus lactis]|nr:hypothetical protein Llab_1769 [Lactococcus lactis]
MIHTSVLTIFFLTFYTKSRTLENFATEPVQKYASSIEWSLTKGTTAQIGE